MCGLVGVVGDIYDVDKKMFEFMLKLDTVRGHHSTGIARIYEHDRNKFDIIKEVGTPWDLINNKSNEYYNGSNSGTQAGNFMAIMGHNRWATVGNINADNAHPFNAGKIIGAHNGTLPQHHRSKLEDFQYYETDSEAIMFNFDKNGVKETINKIDGAWALTWFNLEEGTFNVLRNKERPLYYAWKDNGRTLYYASEPEFIYMAADRYNIKLKKIDGDECFSFKPDQWYKFTLNKPIMNFSPKSVETSEVKGITYPITGRTHYVSTTTGSTSGTKITSSNSIFTKGSANSATLSGPSSKWQDWVKRKGQRIEFSVGASIYLDEQRKEYIPARVVNDGALIRIYDSISRPDLFSLLGDTSALTFTGVIKKVKIKSNSNTFYLTIDPATVSIQLTKSWATKNTQVSEALGRLFKEDKVEEKVDENTVYKIGHNKFTTLEGYKRAVKIGCCWCSYEPEPEDHNDVLWYNNETFLCKDCAKDEKTVNYTAYYAQH